jgi:hypothetical protein
MMLLRRIGEKIVEEKSDSSGLTEIFREKVYCVQ